MQQHTHPLQLLAFMLVGMVLVGCGQAQVEPAAVLDAPSAAVATTVAPTATVVPTATGTPTSTPTAVPTLTPTATHTATAVPTATSIPSPTPEPTATLIPTPVGLPAAPNGWRWELHATAVPVTHYITTEVYPDLHDAEVELAYGPNDEPLPGLRPLPRTFLMETAYQGSGLLPNGDLLEHAETRAPVKRELVPFRFVITPQEKCDGYPIAGNSTCSIPFKTAATTWQDDGPLVPVGSRIYIVELGLKVIVNDVALTPDIPHKIDLYTGYVNNYHYERPDGSDIWILVPND